MNALEKTVDFIAESMRAGTPPWRKPWPGFPTNSFTNKSYSGINSLLLDAVAIQRLYPSRFWATYKQWGWLGCNVRKRPDNISEGQWAVKIHLLDGKTAWVLNAAQVFGLEAEKWNKTENFDPHYDCAERLFETTNVQWNWGTSEQPQYRRPPHDDICMPLLEQFSDKVQLIASQFHELIHWSEWRTGWSGDDVQGELVAEIATGMLETEFGLPHCSDLTNHHKYLQHWLEKMGENPHYLLEAIAQANKAVGFVLQRKN